MSQPYYHVSHSTGGRARHRSEQPVDDGMFARDPARWLADKRRRLARRAKVVDERWQREKRRTEAARGLTILVLVAACFPLGGCAGFLAAGAAALKYGAPMVVFGKDVFDLDTSWNQSHPDKTPIEKVLLPQLEVPK